MVLDYFYIDTPLGDTRSLRRNLPGLVHHELHLFVFNRGSFGFGGKSLHFDECSQSFHISEGLPDFHC